MADRGRKGLQDPHVVGHNAGKGLVEGAGVGGQHVGAASEQCDDITPGDVVEQRQHLVTDAVAHEPRIVVGRIQQWLDAEVGTQRHGLVAPQSQDRPGR